jgi:hypothetical protein
MARLKRADMSNGATGKFASARGIREAEGKFFIAPEAPPAMRQKQARARFIQKAR